MGIFDEVYDRKNTRSVKWDMLQAVFQSDEVLPMWVADMDFKAPEEVNQALVDRAKHGIYGYTVVDEDVSSAIVDWLKNRHSWTIDKSWLSYSPGVVTSLHMAVQAFTDPGDRILLQTPVYTPFYNVIEAHDRVVVKNPLVNQDNHYKIDFADFEDKLKSGVKAFILCSPHNPVGRVWTREELQRMTDLCLQYDVLILSDEIHGDLTFPAAQHIPVATLSDRVAANTLTFMAPSKTFNLAGLDSSYVVTPDMEKRKQLDAVFTKQGFHNMLNTMGNTAMEAAYRHGEKWLDELTVLLEQHKHYVSEMLHKHAPPLKVVDSEGTYLLWIDCSGLGMESKQLRKFMVEEAKVGLNAGVEYGEEGEQYMRMNIACPRKTLEEGTKRIIDAVKALQPQGR